MSIVSRNIGFTAFSLFWPIQKLQGAVFRTSHFSSWFNFRSFSVSLVFMTYRTSYNVQEIIAASTINQSSTHVFIGCFLQQYQKSQAWQWIESESNLSHENETHVHFSQFYSIIEQLSNWKLNKLWDKQYKNRFSLLYGLISIDVLFSCVHCDFIMRMFSSILGTSLPVLIFYVSNCIINQLASNDWLFLLKGLAF